jgi:hypothetical protein
MTRDTVHASALAALAALALAAATWGGCSGTTPPLGSEGCESSPDPNTDDCYCPQGGSCSMTCPSTEASCTMDCANGNTSCSLIGADDCSALCQNAVDCTVECQANAVVACQGVSGTCTATVGDGGIVHCEGAHLCDLTCTGSCAVDCPDGTCKVACTDPATCTLTCDKGGAAATTCPDGMTKVCGAGC